MREGRRKEGREKERKDCRNGVWEGGREGERKIGRTRHSKIENNLYHIYITAEVLIQSH